MCVCVSCAKVSTSRYLLVLFQLRFFWQLDACINAHFIFFCYGLGLVSEVKYCPALIHETVNVASGT